MVASSLPIAEFINYIVLSKLSGTQSGYLTELLPTPVAPMILENIMWVTHSKSGSDYVRNDDVLVGHLTDSAGSG
jgi:hypothetical protein